MIADGLGPVYNAQACSECHQNPVTGSVSQITELRAGHLDSFGNFVDAPGGSLINDRAINAKIQERVPPLFSAGLEKDDARYKRPALRSTRWATASSKLSPTSCCSPSRPSSRMTTRSGHLVQGQAIAVPIKERRPTRAAHLPHRPLRPQGSARQPALLLRRRLSQRDGHHQPTSSCWRTLRSAARPPRSTPCPTTQPCDSDPSRQLRRGRRGGHQRLRTVYARDEGAGRATRTLAATDEGADGRKSCSTRPAAPSAMCRYARRPRRRASSSTPGRSRCPRRSPTRSSTPSATSSCTTSARATASCRTAGRGRV